MLRDLVDRRETGAIHGQPVHCGARQAETEAGRGRNGIRPALSGNRYPYDQGGGSPRAHADGVPWRWSRASLTDPNTFDHERFDRELEKLYPQWEAFLKRSYSAIRANHSDLLQQAAEDLLSAVRNNPAREVRDWTQFGFQFLHRRIADHFR